jgi:putative polyhydroxyalkanoate system protein
MATIEITRSHALQIADLKQKIDGMSGTLDAKYGVKGRWLGDDMILEGHGMASGVKGRIVLTATTVRVEIDLPFMLKMMKGQVEESVTRRLDRALAGG